MGAGPSNLLFCECGNALSGKQQHCSARCRARASIERRYVRKPVKRTATTPEVYRRLAKWLAAKEVRTWD